MAEQRSSSVLTAPVRGAASVLGRLPGAGTVSRVAEGTLNKVAAVSPRSRRLAVYTGAGVLGVAGVVEWPVALTGAAVAWLTQPRPSVGSAGQAGAGVARIGEPVEDGEPVERSDVADVPEEPVAVEPDDEAMAWAATHRTVPAGEGPGQRLGGSGERGGSAGHGGSVGPGAAGHGVAGEHGGSAVHGGHGVHGGPLGPTARPGRTTR
ncbi:hypothetical protein ACIRUL_09705 [Streptomyces sp. NPDC101171]|uniref:hypothetical protein n=1 Tax=Streptomyces sp. NPDC101171 TaxID=3366122 RepID=UPI00382435A1